MNETWYGIGGSTLGFLGGAIAFITIYIAAVGSVGWVIGIALGWIPAYLGAVAAFIFLRYLWLPSIILIVGTLLLI